MRREEQLDDMIADNRKLSVSPSDAQAERDELRQKLDHATRENEKLSKGLYDRIKQRSRYINLSAVDTALDHIDFLNLQNGELRDALAWVKRNHNGYPEGHSTCGVCSRIDNALDGKVCPVCSDRKTIDIGPPHGVVPCALCGVTEKRNALCVCRMDADEPSRKCPIHNGA